MYIVDFTSCDVIGVTDSLHQLLSKRQNSATICRRSPMMPDILYLWLLALTKRMAVSIVYLTKSISANIPATWAWQLRDQLNWPLR